MELIITLFPSNYVQFYAKQNLHQHRGTGKMLKALCSQGKPWCSSTPSMTSWQMYDKLQGAGIQREQKLPLGVFLNILETNPEIL